VAEERLLTVAEVAEQFQVDEQTVRRWIRQGRLVAHNLGGKAGYRIQRRDLQDFLDSMRESAVEGKTGAAA
jgi:excisionase family DNA binding protein